MDFPDGSWAGRKTAEVCARPFIVLDEKRQMGKLGEKAKRHKKALLQC